ncbi:BTB/POZ and TAZ domain-containing protein 1-like isoform X2 [Diospyros lotus]|uniref:BTB/POZ and TAZ domain-containing protein 1-like isoform X2 n=2 Tax=Diospyros lotus TaxID=55363 RepID=UPI00224D46DC|nr:BTB/POZ and TAZ domain-containing protein 1-like isoform X2 [Diospyros lotus]
MSPANFSNSTIGIPPFPADSGRGSGGLPEPDARIVTSCGTSMPAHRSVLASASPVLESIIDRPRKYWNSEMAIPILGVPSESVAVFIRFLYNSKCSEDELDQYGIHLLALSHVFLVPKLKQRCSKALAERYLKIDNVVDVLQLARLCDASDLYLKCLKMVYHNFKYVEKTEGWKFLQDHDPWLELQILQFIDETELRKKRTRRRREEQSLYLQLSEAMECLEHICTEGCTSVGPCDIEPTKNRGPCSKFATCRALQILIQHFATCKQRVHGQCSRCRRMWQLLKLHSSICAQPDLCRVPLCRQFKLKAREDKKGDEGKWKVLARKVVSAKAISSLSLPKRKRDEEALDAP